MQNRAHHSLASLRLAKKTLDELGKRKVCKPPAEIVAAAKAKPKSMAHKTVMTFCDILGGFAGNTALTMGAAGGVIVGGGVSRHIAPFIAESDFEGHFKNKGSGAWYVKNIPVKLVMAVLCRYMAPQRWYCRGVIKRVN